MKEAIEKVLSDETYTTNEEKVNAITKELGTLVFPKDKFDDINKRLKKTEADYAALQTEYDDFKKSKMTDDEKRQSEMEEFEKQKKANAIEKNDLAVQKLLLKNGIEIKDDDVELQNTLKNIISEDEEKTMSLANSFISIINKTKDLTQKQTTTDLLKGTPKPIGGGSDSSSSLSKVDMLKKEYDEAVKNKDQFRQTELMTAIYQAEQETQKP